VWPADHRYGSPARSIAHLLGMDVSAGRSAPQCDQPFRLLMTRKKQLRCQNEDALTPLVRVKHTRTDLQAAMISIGDDLARGQKSAPQGNRPWRVIAHFDLKGKDHMATRHTTSPRNGPWI